MIKLYGYWRSTAAYRVRIALNMKQIAYSNQSIHLVKEGGEQNKPEYLALNPQALVPTIVDGDFVLGQSIAILEYLEEKYPQPALLPKDIKLRAFARQLCQLIASDIHPLNNLRVLQYLSNELNLADDAKKTWYHRWLHRGFTAYESLVSKHSVNGNYSIGDELSLADVCLIPQIYNAHRFDFPMDGFPRLMTINENCLKLERFRNAVPENQPDAAQ